MPSKTQPKTIIVLVVLAALIAVPANYFLSRPSSDQTAAVSQNGEDGSPAETVVEEVRVGIGIERTRLLNNFSNRRLGFDFKKGDDVDGQGSYIGVKGASSIQLIGEGEQIDSVQASIDMTDDDEFADLVFNEISGHVDEDGRAWVDEALDRATGSDDFEDSKTIDGLHYSVTITRQTDDNRRIGTLEIN